MFPFKLLEVYYIKNKKSGKISENVMVKKLKYCCPRASIPGLRRESPTTSPLDHLGYVANMGVF